MRLFMSSRINVYVCAHVVVYADGRFMPYKELQHMCNHITHNRFPKHTHTTHTCQDNRRTVVHIPINRFGDGYGDPRSAARDLAIQLAKEYVASEVMDKKALVKLRNERLPKKQKAKAKAKASASRQRALPGPRFVNEDAGKQKDEQEEEYDFSVALSNAAPSNVTENVTEHGATEQSSANQQGSVHRRFHDMTCIPLGTMSDSEPYSPRTPT